MCLPTPVVLLYFVTVTAIAHKPAKDQQREYQKLYFKNGSGIRGVRVVHFVMSADAFAAPPRGS